ncbi:hypothetical protein BX666DRAFT_1866873 [Dichotomocladium elegans]|nr:hypothetical protein BX666DRAFT_1866873 [Dichotomocladium elegans]
MGSDSVSWLTDADDTPFQYNYLVSLFSAPDMVEHLAQSTLGEDVYALPIHIQRLLCEAKEEVTQQPSLALTRLQHVRDYVWIQSGGDVANMMVAITELMSDEDELENVLGF